MLILNKKRIIFLNIVIVFSILFQSIKYKEKNITVSSTPVSNHIIIIDAGHGFPDGGATGIDGSTIEANLNLKIALKLQKLLEASNCTIILTRSDENGIYDVDADTIRKQKVSDMKNRVKIANNSNAEFFISIHMNKLNESNVSGFQTFYKNQDELSKRIAKCIQKSLNYYIKEDNKKEIKSISNIYLAKNIEIPLVLVECGFLSNEQENSLLKNDSYQDKIAWSIYTGIMDYYENNN